MYKKTTKLQLLALHLQFFFVSFVAVVCIVCEFLFVVLCIYKNADNRPARFLIIIINIPARPPPPPLRTRNPNFKTSTKTEKKNYSTQQNKKKS